MAYLVVAVLCTLMGCAGYYMYGTAALDIIPMNLGGNLAKLCAFVILINPVAKFALTMEPVAAAAQSAAGNPAGIVRLAVRTVVAIAILMAARSLPFLAYVMALVSGAERIGVGWVGRAWCCSHSRLARGPQLGPVYLHMCMYVLAAHKHAPVPGAAALRGCGTACRCQRPAGP